MQTKSWAPPAPVPPATGSSTTVRVTRASASKVSISLYLGLGRRRGLVCRLRRGLVLLMRRGTGMRWCMWRLRGRGGCEGMRYPFMRWMIVCVMLSCLRGLLRLYSLVARSSQRMSVMDMTFKTGLVVKTSLEVSQRHQPQLRGGMGTAEVAAQSSRRVVWSCKLGT